MKRFDYQRADTQKQAVDMAAALGKEGVDHHKTSRVRHTQVTNGQVTSHNATHIEAGAAIKFIAGGTNLLDLMKLNIETPSTLIDINRLDLNTIAPTPAGGLRIGALVTNTTLASDPHIVANYPVLSRAILSGATVQLRNKATTGGNLLQKTRCYYFYQTDSPCNKRMPGSGCPAIKGQNRSLAILGTSDSCIAQHPSDMAVAMRLLDATVETLKTDGTARSIALKDFYCPPKDTPEVETVLEAGELITHVVLPPPINGMHTYDKVRDRASYAFALVSCAAIIKVDQSGMLETVKLAFGGIGVMPWRDEAAEAMLVGTHGGVPDIVHAANVLLANAVTYGHNDFKVPLTRRLLQHVIKRALAAQNNSPSSPHPLKEVFSS